jgi:AcrR family transcriptional regulator
MWRMPRIVDHEQRRRELAAAAWRIIARESLEGVTIRSIARESGYSNGILAHYLGDKDAILAQALRFSHDQINGRFGEIIAEHRGLDGLRILLLDNLPLDEQRRGETQVELNFWSRALINEGLAEFQRREAAGLRSLVRRFVVQAQADGDLPHELGADDAVELLVALVDGLSLHALLYPEHFTPERIVKLVEEQLRLLAQ